MSTSLRKLPPRPTIAIVGVGAVGGYYGGKLIKAGYDVHLLLRSDFDAVRAAGLRIRSDIEPGFDLPPATLKVHRDPRDMPPPDLAIVALKATGNSAYQSLIEPLLQPSTVLLTLQNGLGNEDQLARLFGAERVVGGMAFVCIHRTAPGIIHHIDHGFLKVGDYVPATGESQAAQGAPRPPSPRVQQIAELFRSSGVRCDVLDDLRRGRWEKLVWNIPFNGLGAALDVATDRLLATDEGRSLVRELMSEVLAIAAADGATLPAEVIDRQIQNTASMGAYQSSMQIDRRAGRALEVEAILGEPLRRASELGVPTPRLAWLYSLVKLVDSGTPAKT